MRARRFLSSAAHRRWPVWAFALALVLQAATPLLARAAAELAGVPVAEVCSVWGVETVVLPSAADPHAAHRAAAAHAHDHHAAGHAGSGAPTSHDPSGHATHCALTGLVALDASAAVPTVAVSRADAAVASTWVRTEPPRRDASARWASLRDHGPPATG